MSSSLIHILWEVPLIFVALFVITRLQGKKQMSNLTYFDYITGIVLGEIAGSLLSDDDVNPIRVLLSLALLTILSIISSRFILRSRKFRKFAEGEPIIIIKDGKILEKNLKKVQLDFDNLGMLLREAGVFSYSDVEYAVLEVDGQLSLLKKAEADSVTRADLHLDDRHSRPGVELVVDGVVDHSKLKELKLDQQWLNQTLAQHGVEDISHVNFMEINGNGKIFIDTDNDHEKNKSDSANVNKQKTSE